MRFACEQCQTKYSIPDDRVRGKILKIRCKNCGCLISVSEGGVRTARAEPAGSASMSGLAADAPSEGGDSTMIGGMADFFGKGFPPPDAADDWHLSIDGNQNGPMPLSDLTQRILEQAGSSAELYIWRDGYDGWKAVESVPEVQAAVEKARGATVKPAASAAKAPLAALESDNGGDATQIGSLNLPLDIGKTDDKVDDDVQDLSMMSLDADAFEALIEKKPAAKPAAPPPPKAPPPFKSPPPKPAAPPPKPAAPPPKPAAPPPKPAVAAAPPAKSPGPLFKTLPHPGLRPAEPEPAPPAPAPAPTPAPIAPAVQAESVPNLASLMPPSTPPASTPPASTPPPSNPPPSSSPPSFPPPEPAGFPPNQFGAGGLDDGLSSSEPLKSKSKLPLLLIVGLVLAVVGGGGYFFLTRPGNPLGPQIEKPTAVVDAGTPPDASPPDAGAKAGGNNGKPDEKKGKSEIEGLKEDTFKDLLESGTKALTKCYTKALKKDSALGGTKLKVEVEVSGKGKASEINVEGDGEKLGKCIEKAVKKWKFPKGEDKKPYKVRFPLTVDKS